MTSGSMQKADARNIGDVAFVLPVMMMKMVMRVTFKLS
jgi:hypothetical protein